MNQLTHQEQKIVALVAQGLTNKEIAQELGSSHFTVRNQVRVIIRKLEMKNRESFLKGLLGLASSLKTIPDAPYGDDSAGMAGVWFDLLPKPPDMDRHGVITL